ncbi:unnamed protein product [Lampetra fluviatilis]
MLELMMMELMELTRGEEGHHQRGVQDHDCAQEREWGAASWDLETCGGGSEGTAASLVARNEEAREATPTDAHLVSRSCQGGQRQLRRNQPSSIPGPQRRMNVSEK